MRSLERNKITIYYALYDANIPVLDEPRKRNRDKLTTRYLGKLNSKLRVSAIKAKQEEKAFGKFLITTGEQ